MGLFDGVSGMLAEVFGAPVTYTPAGGSPRDIQSVFRDGPIRVMDEDDYPVLITAPTWKVQRHLVPELARGDRVEPGDGRVFKIKNIHPSGSPASDAFVICELERILP